ncbi:MAG: hypothetical protein Q8P67_05710 [archaeon]|nr:hypothetical protein [archaeon]
MMVGLKYNSNQKKVLIGLVWIKIHWKNIIIKERRRRRRRRRRKEEKAPPSFSQAFPT